MLEQLLERFRKGDRLALSRLVSLVARGEYVSEILAGAGPRHRPARVVAITGGGGVGKSTLVGKLIERARTSGQKVAVLACDPQSPLTGGALLGDRFRMPVRPDDDGVFIRSLAAMGGRGALAENLDPLIRLLEAFGFDIVFIETVGAGQGDTAVHELADVLVYLLQPETGDDLQWEKAGLLEVADVVVIHKADMPGADRVEAQVLATLGLSGASTPPVVRVSSRSGAGIDRLWSIIVAAELRRADTRDPFALLRRTQEVLANRFRAALSASQPDLLRLLASWQRGEKQTSQTANEVLDLLAQCGPR